MQACERLGPEHKFDAVVVDEGQDFRELWWTSLESVFRDPDDKACYYVFFDPNQNLYVQRALPATGVRPALRAATGKLPQYRAHRRPTAPRCSATRPEVAGTARPMGDEPEVVQCAHDRRCVQGGGQASAAACACPTWEGSRCHRWRCWRRDSAATIGRINSGRFRLRGALKNGARDKGVLDRFVASVQGVGGGCHRDHRDARSGMRGGSG